MVQISYLFSLLFQLLCCFYTKISSLYSLFVDFFKLDYLVESHFRIIFQHLFSASLLHLIFIIWSIPSNWLLIQFILQLFLNFFIFLLKLVYLLGLLSQLLPNFQKRKITTGMSYFLNYPSTIDLSPSISLYLFSRSYKFLFIFYNLALFLSIQLIKRLIFHHHLTYYTHWNEFR